MLPYQWVPQGLVLAKGPPQEEQKIAQLDHEQFLLFSLYLALQEEHIRAYMNLASVHLQYLAPLRVLWRDKKGDHQ
jgi:hypothetical protein